MVKKKPVAEDTPPEESKALVPFLDENKVEPLLPDESPKRIPKKGKKNVEGFGDDPFNPGAEQPDMDGEHKNPDCPPANFVPAMEAYDVKINVTIKPHNGGDSMTRPFSIGNLHSERAIYDPELIREAFVVADSKLKVDKSQMQLPI